MSGEMRGAGQKDCGLACPAKARRCGGCPLLELPYEEQLRQKQQFVERLLGRFAPVEPILGMEEPLHYRNKVIATFAAVRGKLDCGIYEESSHRVVPVRNCLLQDSRLNEVAEAVLLAARRCRLTAYDEDRGSGLLRHMVLRRGVRTGQVSVTLVTPTSFFPGSRNFVRLLTAQCPDVVTVVQNINPRHTSAVLGSAEKLLYGKGYLEDLLCGKRFAIAPRAFYQINPVQTERLYNTALSFAGLTGKERVIDAYCGIGTIALAASDHAAAVLGVELNADAVKSARRNAARNHAGNAAFLCGDAGALMRQMAQEGEKADLVFFDPPREGASREFLDALIRLSPGVWSTSPATPRRRRGILHSSHPAATGRSGSSRSTSSPTQDMWRRLSCFPREKSTRRKCVWSFLWRTWICPGSRRVRLMSRLKRMCWSIPV